MSECARKKARTDFYRPRCPSLNWRTIKDLKDLRASCVLQAIDIKDLKDLSRLRSPHRNRAGSGDPALQIRGEAAVCSRCRLRSPDRNRSRSGDLNLQGRDDCCRAGDRSPRDGILYLYRRARACPSPLLESPITALETGPRATGHHGPFYRRERKRSFFMREWTTKCS